MKPMNKSSSVNLLAEQPANNVAVVSFNKVIDFPPDH